MERRTSVVLHEKTSVGSNVVGAFFQSSNVNPKNKPLCWLTLFRNLFMANATGVASVLSLVVSNHCKNDCHVILPLFPFVPFLPSRRK